MIKLLLSVDHISLDTSDCFHFAFKTELVLWNAYNNGTFLWSRMRSFTSSIPLPVRILSYRKQILASSILKLFKTSKLHKPSSYRKAKPRPPLGRRAANDRGVWIPAPDTRASRCRWKSAFYCPQSIGLISESHMEFHRCPKQTTSGSYKLWFIACFLSPWILIMSRSCNYYICICFIHLRVFLCY